MSARTEQAHSASIPAVGTDVAEAPMRAWIGLAVAVCLGGCSDRSLEATTPPPAGCQATADERAAAAAETNPIDLTLSISNEGWLAHWTLESGCIGVSYDPSMSTMADAIAAAVAQWNALPCNPVCLEAPVEEPVSKPPYDSDLHKVLITAAYDWAYSPANPYWYRTTPIYHSDSGRIVAAYVSIPSPPIKPEWLLTALGEALGVRRTIEWSPFPDPVATLQTLQDIVCMLYARCQD